MAGLPPPPGIRAYIDELPTFCVGAAAGPPKPAGGAAPRTASTRPVAAPLIDPDPSLPLESRGRSRSRRSTEPIRSMTQPAADSRTRSRRKTSDELGAAPRSQSARSPKEGRSRSRSRRTSRESEDVAGGESVEGPRSPSQRRSRSKTTDELPEGAEAAPSASGWSQRRRARTTSDLPQLAEQDGELQRMSEAVAAKMRTWERTFRREHGAVRARRTHAGRRTLLRAGVEEAEAA